MLVTKYSGEKERFSEEKLVKGLENSGIEPAAISFVTSQIKKSLFNGITTKKVYQEVRRLLRAYSNEYVSKYKLKQAILELGPSGYPFESYVATILQAMGFETETNVTVLGKCVQHEVDVVAEKEDHHYMIECKFHNRQGFKTDVKVPLYIQSRFKDVEHSWRRKSGHRDKFHQGWIVTNARFTADAITYAKCAGLKLLGWDYPKNESLKVLVSSYGLHPLTCLSTLTKAEKKLLLSKGIVLCRTVCDNPDILTDIGFEYGKVKKVVHEGRHVCELGVKVLSRS